MRSRLAALLVMLAPVQALAHPHVLIDSHAIFEMKDGKITALQMGWKFDPVYGGTLAQDYDADKDGKLNPAEMAKLEQESFQDTRQHSYFTYVSVDGKRIADLKATDFKVLIVGGAMVYSFRLPLPEPVDPRTQKVKVSTYEETYYVDIIFPNEKAVVVNGQGAEGCRTTLSEDRENPLMGGVVFPKKADVICD